MAEPQVLVQLSKEICTYLVHAFGAGTLTTTGAQYGSSGVSTSTDVWKVVETKTIQPFTAEGWGLGGQILEIEFALTAGAISDTSTAAIVQYNWQAKSLAATATDAWQWLLPTSSGHSTAVGPTEVETTYSGYMTITTDYLDKVPLQIRLLVMSGKGSTSGGSATAAYVRAKNSSYVKVMYRVA